MAAILELEPGSNANRVKTFKRVVGLLVNYLTDPRLLLNPEVIRAALLQGSLDSKNFVLELTFGEDWKTLVAMTNGSITILRALSDRYDVDLLKNSYTGPGDAEQVLKAAESLIAHIATLLLGYGLMTNARTIS
ncbi:MAG TPA: hypothetical protein VLA77_02880 [Candidatus Saccharimonadales bacterium]|nr:hypothetical protein [Candidatus Saccharimonadales bacterium]